MTTRPEPQTAERGGGGTEYDDEREKGRAKRSGKPARPSFGQGKGGGEVKISVPRGRSFGASAIRGPVFLWVVILTCM